MKIIQTKDYEEMSEKASNIILEDISKKQNLTICLPTGNTPKGMYNNLVNAYKKNKADFSKIKTFNLDEYYPAKPKRSYSEYMHKIFFDKVNIPRKNIHLLDGTTKDTDKECKEFEEKIKKNPIDLQILGIGENGHIAFNEPGSKLNSKTRLVELTHIYGRGLTMGISTILKSKKIILLASGKKKAPAIRWLVKGKISPKLPASFLRNHKSFILIIDKQAASLL